MKFKTIVTPPLQHHHHKGCVVCGHISATHGGQIGADHCASEHAAELGQWVQHVVACGGGGRSVWRRRDWQGHPVASRVQVVRHQRQPQKHHQSHQASQWVVFGLVFAASTTLFYSTLLSILITHLLTHCIHHHLWLTNQIHHFHQPSYPPLPFFLFSLPFISVHPSSKSSHHHHHSFNSQITIVTPPTSHHILPSVDWHRTGGVLLLGYEMYRLLIKTRGGVLAKNLKILFMKKMNNTWIIILVPFLSSFCFQSMFSTFLILHTFIHPFPVCYSFSFIHLLSIHSTGIPPKPRRAARRVQTTTEPVIIDVDEEEGNKEIIKSKRLSQLINFQIFKNKNWFQFYWVCFNLKNMVCLYKKCMLVKKKTFYINTLDTLFSLSLHLFSPSICLYLFTFFHLSHHSSIFSSPSQSSILLFFYPFLKFCHFPIRPQRGSSEARAWSGGVWRRSSHQKLPRQHLSSAQEHQDQVPMGLKGGWMRDDWLVSYSCGTWIH